ncbi:MAG: hypothetical protein SFW67_21450 [Myxococcaceae bacterium]|nr:hypothetical protein [Myxococcaceae bacterium]
MSFRRGVDREVVPRSALVAVGLLLATCGPEPASRFEILRPIAPFDCQRVFMLQGALPPAALTVGDRVALALQFVIELRCPQGPVPPDSVDVEVRDAEGAVVASAPVVQTGLFEVGARRQHQTTIRLEVVVPATSRLSLRISAEPAIGVVVVPLLVFQPRVRTWRQLPDGVTGIVEGPVGSDPVIVGTLGVVLPPGVTERAEVLAVTTSDVWLFTLDRRIRFRPDAGRSEWVSPRTTAASPLGSSLVVSDAEGLALITEDGARQVVLPSASPFDVIHFANERTVTLLRGGQLMRVDLRQPVPLPPLGFPEQDASSSREGLWFRRGSVLTLVDAEGRQSSIDFPSSINRNVSVPTRERVPVGDFADAAGRRFMVVPRRADGGLELEAVQVPAGTMPYWASSTRLFAISNAPMSSAVWEASRDP